MHHGSLCFVFLCESITMDMAIISKKKNIHNIQSNPRSCFSACMHSLKLKRFPEH